MREGETRADLLMLEGVSALCADCGGERVFVPVEESSPAGGFCCTSCDAAVFLLVSVRRPPRSHSRVA